MFVGDLGKRFVRAGARRRTSTDDRFRPGSPTHGRFVVAGTGDREERTRFCGYTRPREVEGRRGRGTSFAVVVVVGARRHRVVLPTVLADSRLAVLGDHARERRGLDSPTALTTSRLGGAFVGDHTGIVRDRVTAREARRVAKMRERRLQRHRNRYVLGA